jgi:hypothetical protein
MKRGAHVREFFDDNGEAAENLEVDVGGGIGVHSEVRLHDDLHAGCCEPAGKLHRKEELSLHLSAAVIGVVALNKQRDAGGRNADGGSAK